MNRAFVLGVDGGGSKTECALQERTGARRWVARGNGTNHEIHGFECAGRNLREVVSEVLQQAGVAPSDIAAACFSMAGMDIPPDRENIRTLMVEPLGLSCPITICNDAFAGFRAGSPHGMGLCVSVGSGLTFCGKNSAGATHQSEFPRPLGIDALIRNALVSEYFGIGPKCGFTRAYLEALRLDTLEAFFLSIYAANRTFLKPVDPVLIIEARRTVLNAATFSDPVTCGMLRKFAVELAETLCGMGRRLSLGAVDFDLVLSGSILTKGQHPALNDTIVAEVRRSFPGAQPVIVDGLPVDGAVLMAGDLLP